MPAFKLVSGIFIETVAPNKAPIAIPRTIFEKIPPNTTLDIMEISRGTVVMIMLAERYPLNVFESLEKNQEIKYKIQKGTTKTPPPIPKRPPIKPTTIPKKI